MRKTLKLLLVTTMVSLMVLSSISVAFASTTPIAPVVYVATDGTGDFNCDGGENDQVEIQAAIDFVLANEGFTTIHLKAGTYTTNDTIFIGGKPDQKVILEGEEGTVLLLSSNVCWNNWDNKAMIQEKNTGGFGAAPNGDVYNSGNIIIRGFKIDGNGPNVHRGIEMLRPTPTSPKVATEVVLTYPDNCGHGSYYNIMYINQCNDVEVYNMYLTHNYNDGLYARKCTNLKYHDNYIDEIGHDGLSTYKCDYIDAYNNTMFIQCNCGIRIYCSNHAKLYNNDISAKGFKGANGIQIQKESLIGDVTGTSIMNDIEVFNNTLHDIRYGGIWIVAYNGKNATENVYVHVYNNTIYNCGWNDNAGEVLSNIGQKGGIITDGFNALIENNVIDGCYGAGINVHHNTQFSASLLGPFTLTIRNNIISNTKDNPLIRYTPEEQSGYGIYYELQARHNFIVEYNCFYNNNAADYGHLTTTSDVGNLFGQDPLFTDAANHDYHLMSQYGRWNGSKFVNDDVTSPCIDAGDPSYEYANEPVENGAIINIGRFGNTAEASKSNLVAKPIASVEPGTYLLPQRTTLTSATEGAIIRYTTDGSEPTMDSKIYKNPIPVTPSVTIIKAFAYKEGMLDSRVISFEFVVDPSLNGNHYGNK